MDGLRTKQLLQAIIETHRDMRCLDGSFLSDNEVTASECDIFYLVADILDGYLKLPAHEQIRIKLLGGGEDAGMVNLIADTMKGYDARERANEAFGAFVEQSNAQQDEKR